jgi:hypothetical protein
MLYNPHNTTCVVKKTIAYKKAVVINSAHNRKNFARKQKFIATSVAVLAGN